MVSAALRNQTDYSEYNITFADKEDISDWAVPYVGEVQKQGIMQGDQNNMFYPLNLANRAEAAMVVYNYLNTK